MHYLDFKLKPCPWCHRTPEIKAPILDDRTWCWSIKCENIDCDMRPETPYVSIRNTSKTDFARFILKMWKLADRWNKGNPLRVIELKRLDISKIAYGFVPYHSISSSNQPFFTTIEDVT